MLKANALGSALASAGWLVVIALAGGCAPQVSYRIYTIVTPTHACERRVTITAVPHPRIPNQRVKLHDYLEFAAAETYENFVLMPERAILNGRFASPEEVPSDFNKITMHTERVARNRIRYRAIDLVLVEVIDYEEEISDIVERREAEAALERLIAIAVDALCKTLRDRCEGRYDTTALEEYIRQNLPALCRRLYSALWEIRRARRGGFSGRTERQEWELRLLEEIANFAGQEAMPEPALPGVRAEVLKALERKLQSLAKPLGGAEPITLAFLQGKDSAEQTAALQTAIARQFGSLEKFFASVEPLLPQVFGAFLINHFSLLPVNPRFDFQMRLSLPGEVVQTNGIRDLDGGILWTFSDEDVALSGYAMWARSLVIRKDEISDLGLVNFPGHLGAVEKFFQELRASGGGLREPLLQALRACVAEKSLAPLERLAACKEEQTEPPADTPAAAQRILAFLKRFQPGAQNNDGPELKPPASEEQRGR